MEKTLSLKDFAILLITTLADNPIEIDLRNRDIKTAILPVDYKQKIENILCANNGWKKRFSILINIDEYFDDHFYWEKQLAKEIKTVLKQMGKDFEYDFANDSIRVSFSQKEIDYILLHYRDEEIKNVMKHFATLINDYIYTREYKEEYYDYDSSSVQYMKKMNNREIR